MIKKEIVKNRLKNLHMSHSLNGLDNILIDTEKNKVSYLDFLNSLLEIEEDGREIKRIANHVKQAKFPLIKTITDFDFTRIAGLDKHRILSYCEGDFLDRKENIIFIGNPGTGKTHLSIAIAYELCKKCKKVLYTTGTKLATMMIEARDEKELARFMLKAGKLDLVIIDEIGYFPYEKDASEMLFQYISERYERGSIIITTNLPFSRWNEIFYTEILTTAVLDRLAHHGNVVEMNAESYRFTQSLKKKNNKKKIN